MAAVRGGVLGDTASEATRLSASEIHLWANTFDDSLFFSLRRDGHLTIFHRPGGCARFDVDGCVELWRGPVEDFVAFMRAAKSLTTALTEGKTAA